MLKKLIWIGGSIIGVLSIGGILGLLSTRQTASAKKLHREEAQMAPASTTPSVPTEIVTVSTDSILGSSANSWPGEIVSDGDVEVYPSREGHLVAWNVQIGEHVMQGQSLGRLSPQSVTVELTSALAEREAALSRATTKVTANERYIEQAKKRLETLKRALLVSRDTAIQLAERDAERDRQSSAGAEKERLAERVSREAAIRSAETDLEQTRAFIPIKRRSARVAIERLFQRIGGKFSITGASPTTPLEAQAMEFHRTIGVLNSETREAYRRALINLVSALKDQQALPEEIAQEYMRASLALLSNSVSSYEFSATALNDLRTDFTDDQKDFYDALKEYKEIQRSIVVKEANLRKLTADRDRDVAAADTQASVANLTAQSSDTSKRKTVAEVEVEFAKEQNELDASLANLQRDLELARGEVRAVEVAYGSLAKGVTGQEILAPFSGVISAILQRNGDHVTPETAVASLTQHGNETKFIRFHIPNNVSRPTVGTKVRIERPGYSLEKLKGTITGVGAALDSSGSYMAEATLDEATEWPVHTSIRVSLEQSAPSISIPLQAVWWSEDGKPNVWLAVSSTAFTARAISVGRVLGDQVEVLNGIEPGMKYLPNLDAQSKKQATFLSATGTPMIEKHNTLQSQDQDKEAPVPRKKKIGTDMHGDDHEE